MPPARAFQQHAVPPVRPESRKGAEPNHQELGLENCQRGVFDRPDGEQQCPGPGSQGQPHRRDRRENPKKGYSINVVPASKKTQVQRQDRADQKRDTKNMQCVNDGISPTRRS